MFVNIKYKNQSAFINRHGGGLAKYLTLDSAGEKHFVFGYDKDEDKEAAQGEILAPFPGRVDQGKYIYNGVPHEIKGNVWKDSNNNVLHGFVLQQMWNVELRNSNSTAVCTFTMNQNEFEHYGYPFSLKFEITYELNEDGLKVTSNVQNVGTKVAPFGIGFHPYFTLPSIFMDKTRKINDLCLHIPAKTLIEYDDKTLKPTGNFLPLENLQGPQKAFQFNKMGTLISTTKIDNCFTDLEKDENGIVRTKLYDPKNQNDSVIVWQDGNKFPYIQVYSYDYSDHGNERRGIAIEPESCCGFAANVEGFGLLDLKPNEIFQGSWGITFLGASQ